MGTVQRGELGGEGRPGVQIYDKGGAGKGAAAGVTSEPLDHRAECAVSLGGEVQAWQLLCAAATDTNPSSSARGGARACLAGWEARLMVLTRCFQALRSRCQVRPHSPSPRHS